MIDLKPITTIDITVATSIPVDMTTIRQDVYSLLNTIEISYFSLAKYLHTIRDTEVYKSWGYISFKHYVEEELEFKERKAQYLINIYENSNRLGISQDQNQVSKLSEIGWAKAKEVLRVAQDIDQYNSLVEKATTLSVEDLKHEIKTTTQKQDDLGNKVYIKPGTDLHYIDLALNDDQYEPYAQAMLMAKKEAPNASNNQLLSLICLSYIANTDPNQGFLNSMYKWLQQYEKVSS